MWSTTLLIVGTIMKSHHPHRSSAHTPYDCLQPSSCSKPKFALVSEQLQGLERISSSLAHLAGAHGQVHCYVAVYHSPGSGHRSHNTGLKLQHTVPGRAGTNHPKFMRPMLCNHHHTFHITSYRVNAPVDRFEASPLETWGPAWLACLTATNAPWQDTESCTHLQMRRRGHTHMHRSKLLQLSKQTCRSTVTAVLYLLP